MFSSNNGFIFIDYPNCLNNWYKKAINGFIKGMQAVEPDKT